MNTLIINDASLANSTLSNMITKYCPEVSILGRTGSANKAKKRILTEKPDVILIDFDTPKLNGFDFLKSIDTTNISIIMTTAWDKYAVQAIKNNVHDYLLKPIDPNELIDSFNKLSVKLDKKSESITFDCANKTHKIYLHDIIRCESESNYTHFYLKGGDQITTSFTLKKAEELINNSRFIRTHKSHLINLDFAKNIYKGSSIYLNLSNNEMIPISQRKKNLIIESLKNK